MVGFERRATIFFHSNKKRVHVCARAEIHVESDLLFAIRYPVSLLEAPEHGSVHHGSVTAAQQHEIDWFLRREKVRVDHS
jgi:hypothetical protein